jgi:ribonuclease HII
MLFHERRARKAGFRRVAGIDEAGRGPLAGPVVAAALLLKDTRFKQKIDDSKKLTPKMRLLAYKEILKKAWVGIGIVSEKTIDEINIYNATARAMEQALRKLKVKPDFLLVDGRIRLRTRLGRSLIIRGDSESLSIACASIIAKVTRDRMMVKYHKRFPQYGFSRHKGYATAEHTRALKKHGPSPIHRMSFRPVKNLIDHACG